MLTYTRAQLQSDINGRIHGKFGLIANPQNTLNNIVREVRGIKLRSSISKALLAPNLFDGIHTYACPTDIDGNSIVDIQHQTFERGNQEFWELVDPGRFDRLKGSASLIAFGNDSTVRTLLISKSVDDKSLTIANLDTLTSDGGTWALFGDGTNVAVDPDNYVKGSGSVQFDISAAGGTTAGIVNTAVTTFDLTDYKSSGSVFVWAYITSATNLTNFKLRVGNNSTNYYEMTATLTNESVAFSAGWNLLRFDFSGKTTTGSPVDSTCAYIASFMTKTAGKVSETGYKFDHIIAKRGKFMNLIYYSKLLWQNVAGTYLENSTASTDYVVVDTDEYGLMVENGVVHAGMEAREYDDANYAAGRLKVMTREYKSKNVDQSLSMVGSYYEI